MIWKKWGEHAVDELPDNEEFLLCDCINNIVFLGKIISPVDSEEIELRFLHLERMPPDTEPTHYMLLPKTPG